MKTITINIDDALHAEFVSALGENDPVAAVTAVVSDAVESVVRKARIDVAVQSANAEVDKMAFDSIKVKVG